MNTLSERTLTILHHVGEDRQQPKLDKAKQHIATKKETRMMRDEKSMDSLI